MNFLGNMCVSGWVYHFLTNYLNVTHETVGDKYDFIIDTTNYTDSVNKLSGILGVDFIVENHNKTSNKPKINVSSEVSDIFMDKNKEDYLLYNKCRKLFL